MRKKYPELNSDHEVLRELTEMGIDIFQPETSSEEDLAQSFDEFSHFVLHEEKYACLEILENDLHSGCGSVGELQGGSDAYSIYRVSFPSDDEDTISSPSENSNAAVQLLNLFNETHGQSAKSSLTIEKIKQYMLGMCNRRSREQNCRYYTSLGNLMFIMQFGGPTEGQVRHIDNMVPNLQICVYMSARCPSTIVYAMDDGDGLPVTDGTSLIEFWQRQREKTVPELINDILLKHGDRKLKSKWYTKYFAFWNTINQQLLCFGKLYQPVSYQLGMQTSEPGTTLLAGGNEIHAGPPTLESRMFAFAIGIPEEEDDDADEKSEESSTDDDTNDDDGANDGEVQYSPVLLHIDFCCLLFSILDYEYNSKDSEILVAQAKTLLVEILIELIKDYPMKTYLLQIDEERVGIRAWLEFMLDKIENQQSTVNLIEEAASSDKILYTPDVIKRRLKKKKKKEKKVVRKK